MINSISFGKGLAVLFGSFMKTRDEIPPAGKSALPLGAQSAELITLRAEIRLLKFMAALRSQLAGTREVDDAVKRVARACMEFFAADEAVVDVADPPYENGRFFFSTPDSRRSNLGVWLQVVKGEKASLSEKTVYARLKRSDRPWGVLALTANHVEFTKSDRHALARVGAVIDELI